MTGAVQWGLALASLTWSGPTLCMCHCIIKVKWAVLLPILNWRRDGRLVMVWQLERGVEDGGKIVVAEEKQQLSAGSNSS